MDQIPSIAPDLVPADPEPSSGSGVPVTDGRQGTRADEVARRVPATAGRWRRFIAWLVDYLVAVLPGFAIVAIVLASMIQNLPGFVGSVAAEAGWSRIAHVFTPGESVVGWGDAAANEWLWFALPLLLALLAVPAIQFLYQAIMLAWRRRTIGMMIADLRLHSKRGPDPFRRGAAVLRAAVTTFLQTGLVAVALVLMVVGQFTLGVGLWGLAVVAFVANAFASFTPSRRTMIDRISGAVVVRHGLHAVAAKAASSTAATAGRRAADAALAAGQTLSDAAAVTGDIARQGAVALAQTAPVRQVLDSHAVAQARVLGAAGAERARELRGRASDRARAVGDRVRGLWQERQARRSGVTGPPPELVDSAAAAAETTENEESGDAERSPGGTT